MRNSEESAYRYMRLSHWTKLSGLVRADSVSLHEDLIKIQVR